MGEIEQVEFAIRVAPGWVHLKSGMDENGSYVAALELGHGQAHQFRSLEDWSINGRLMASGEGGGNLGIWSERVSEDIP